MGKDLFLCLLKIIFRNFHFWLCKVQVIGCIDGDQVQVGMGHFDADHAKPATVAGEGFFNGPGNWPGKNQHFGKVFITEIKKFIGLCFWDHQHMSFTQGENIQEGKNKSFSAIL